MSGGLYRTRSQETDEEVAVVDHGSLVEVPRAMYVSTKYEPPFKDLPTKAEYEASKKG